MQEPHKPCTCELWERWSLKIAEMLPQIPTLNEQEGNMVIIYTPQGPLQ